MTHDALLDIIEHWNWIEPKTLIKAFRVVVELHKPRQSYLFDDEVCESCSSEEDRSEILYPCPTIEAIEKELK